MALNFATTGDRVNCGSGSSLDDRTAFTWWCWWRAAALNDFGTLMSKGPAADDRKAWFIRSDGRFRIRVVRATLDAEANAATGTLVTNTNTFLAATYDESDGPRLWKGTASAVVAEVSYEVTFPIVGVGATTGDAADSLKIGTNTDDDVPGVGIISSCGVIDARLTAAELAVVQFNQRRPPRNSVGFWHLGWNGTGTQPDWSGNGNSGTVTGATVADHAPLQLWRPSSGRMPAAAVGGGGGTVPREWSQYRRRHG